MNYRFTFNTTNRLFHVVLWDGKKWMMPDDQKYRLEDIPVIHSNLFNWALKS